MGRSPSPPAKRSRRAEEDDGRDRSRGRENRISERDRSNDWERRGSRDGSGDERRGRDRDRDGAGDERRGRNRDRDRDRTAEKERYRDRDETRRREKEDLKSEDGSRKWRGSYVRDRDEDRFERSRDKSETKSRDEGRMQEQKPKEVNGWMNRERVKNTSPSPDKSKTKELKPSSPKFEIQDQLDNDNHEIEAPSAPLASAEKKDGSILLMEEAEAALEAREQAKEKEKEKASFEYSGKLAAETNKVNGVALLFTEPPEARKPTLRWRLYVFKDGEPLNEPLFIHRQSCYLFGRERKIADIPIDHPSCSKQHAVIQYRLIEKEIDGVTTKKTRPYLMDLGSTNKTFLNGEAIEPQRYYELFEQDTIKFGNSSREYVLLHENSAT